MPWRLVSLPSAAVKLLVSPAAPPTSQSPTVSVATQNSAADMLLGYMDAISLAGMETVNNALIADGLLHGKYGDPIGATVAGYYLLKLNPLKPEHKKWAANLAADFPWLPDGAIIDAWYRIRSPSSPGKRAGAIASATGNLSAARERLIEAVARGMPIFTCGLRLLLDGLSLFAQDQKYNNSLVAEALRTARRFGSRVQWGQATMTFTGRDPSSPAQAPTGYAEAPDEVVFLQPRDADVVWRFGAALHGDSPANGIWFARARGETTASADDTGPQLAGSRPPSAAERARWRKISPKLSIGRASLASGLADPDPLRVQARLLRASDLQSQGETFAELKAVSAKIGPSTVDFSGLVIDRIAGRSDLVSVGSVQQALRAAQSIGRITVLKSNGDVGLRANGLLVSPTLVLLNSHDMPSSEAALRAEIMFDYQDDVDGSLTSGPRYLFDPKRLFIIDKALGITVVALAGKDPPVGSSRGWCRLLDAEVKALVGERLSIIQHHNSDAKQLAFRSLQLAYIGDPFAIAAVQFEPWSGAALFNEQWEFIGIHRAVIELGKRAPKRSETAARRSAVRSKSQWYGCEFVRTSRILNALKQIASDSEKVDSAQKQLIDELIYSEPPRSPIPLGSDAPLAESLAPSRMFTIHHGRRYRAILQLGLFEQFAGNDVIADRLKAVGFTNVVATGTGATRQAEGLWPGPDTTAQLDPHITNVVELPAAAVAG